MWSLITGYNRSSFLAISRRPWLSAALAILLVPVLFTARSHRQSDTLLGSRKAQTHYWGGGGLGRFCNLTSLHSLAGPVGQPPSPQGGSNLHPRCAPMLLELGSPVSIVSLQSVQNSCILLKIGEMTPWYPHESPVSKWLPVMIILGSLDSLEMNTPGSHNSPVFNTPVVSQQVFMYISLGWFHGGEYTGGPGLLIIENTRETMTNTNNCMNT